MIEIKFKPSISAIRQQDINNVFITFVMSFCFKDKFET